MNKITTADCIAAIHKWYTQQGLPIPGTFKRIQKCKNENGSYTRIFEHKESSTHFKIIEEQNTLTITKIKRLIGDDYYFSFCYDEDRGDDGVAFVVVAKNFFKRNHHLKSVHFNTDNKMPPEFVEMMESTFAVADGISKEEAYNKLISLGFSENEELTKIMNSDDDYNMNY